MSHVNIRIETYDDWCRLLVDGELRCEGHTTRYIYDDLLDLLSELGAEVETEYFEGQEHGEAACMATGPYRGEGYPAGFLDGLEVE